MRMRAQAEPDMSAPAAMATRSQGAILVMAICLIGGLGLVVARRRRAGDPMGTS